MDANTEDNAIAPTASPASQAEEPTPSGSPTASSIGDIDMALAEEADAMEGLEEDTDAGNATEEMTGGEEEEEESGQTGNDQKDEDTLARRMETKSKLKLELTDSAAMLRMLQSLPESEARRHQYYRRSHFDRGAVKRCMATAIQECTPADRKVPTVTHVMGIVMVGMSKIFVGEITAKARQIMAKNGETGPIQPHHIREARRKYYKKHSLARTKHLH